MVRLPEVVVQTDVLKHYIELRVQYKLGRLDEDAGGKAEWAEKSCYLKTGVSPVG